LSGGVATNGSGNRTRAAARARSRAVAADQRERKPNSRGSAGKTAFGGRLRKIGKTLETASVKSLQLGELRVKLGKLGGLGGLGRCFSARAEYNFKMV